MQYGIFTGSVKSEKNVPYGFVGQSDITKPPNVHALKSGEVYTTIFGKMRGGDGLTGACP